MDKSEYDRYGENPEVAKRRAEVRAAFLSAIKGYLSHEDRSQPLPEGFHGRWGNFTPEDLDFLNEAGIPLRD